LEYGPNFDSESPSQVCDHRVNCNDEIQLFNEGGGIDYSTAVFSRVVDVSRRAQMGEIGPMFSVLDAKERDISQLKNRLQQIHWDGPG
jgi:hypothetical protein